MDLLKWYFIVAYSVGCVLVVCGVVVVVFVCWLHHDQCCERVERKMATRIRVRRSKVKLGKWRVYNYASMYDTKICHFFPIGPQMTLK